MRVENIRESLAKRNFIFKFIAFTEDGYEIRFNPEEKNIITEETRENWLKRVEQVNFEGFIVADVQIEFDNITVMLVPLTFEEMNDFIWRYVEKYGVRNKKLATILGEATCVLQKMLDDVWVMQAKQKGEISQKLNVAYENLRKFEDHIF